ncbi:tyrosine protein kinase [Allopusillimonas soli]|uniref:AAA family ATPase n=1 Tax=Allopusillimonas soli TaxID=659016 RepID=A0A853FH34_9BURK|nr:GNVR domain-containing protein [Allopusillimonas soli]NYT38952.1 AAA family ATPase [Allopusillimonas soli]TEA70054.1 tyrosine protein kinase [Allopusillimonas soli]
MNHASTPTAPANLSLVLAPPQSAEEEDIDFPGILDALFNARRLILLITILGVAAGAAYAFLKQPIYQSDLLIQVEQSQGESDNQILGALASAFDIQSPASAEMQILRSRLVLGQASDTLKLYISAQPDYLPVVGEWLARRAHEPSSSDIPLLDGYVWGNESIDIEHLQVPQALVNRTLTLRMTASGYDLLDPDGKVLAQGMPGVDVAFDTPDGSGSIQVSSLQGNPGDRFNVKRLSRQHVIEKLQHDLVMEEKGKPSGVLSVKLNGTDPVQLAAILNAIGTAYVEQNTARKAAEAEKSLTFLDGFLPQLRKQMDEADDRYTSFRDTHGTFDLGTEGTLSLNTSVQLKTELFSLQQKRRELSVQFAPSHPSIRALDAQISAAQSQLDKLEMHIKGLPDLEQQLLNLRRDAKVNSEIYASLLTSMQQLRLVKEGKVGNVRLVDRAVVPERPIKPNKPMVLAISACAGLLLGAALVLLRSTLGAGIKGASDIESRMGLSVFATVPRTRVRPGRWASGARRNGSAWVLAQSAPNDPAIESLRSLRTSLRPLLYDAPNNIVMLTGPTPHIGKTFTSINLAAVLGSSGKKVLLIDTDFRSGGVHQQFGLPRENGYEELIRGDITVHQAIHKEPIPGVDVITTGNLPLYPAEALLADRAATLLDELSHAYDVVVLDAAPVLPVSDSLALAPHAGVLFLLARAEVTTLDELEESAKRLRQAGAEVSGVILNDFDPGSHKFSSKYGRHRQYQLEYGKHA